MKDTCRFKLFMLFLLRPHSSISIFILWQLAHRNEIILLNPSNKALIYVFFPISGKQPSTNTWPIRIAAEKWHGGQIGGLDETELTWPALVAGHRNVDLVVVSGHLNKCPKHHFSSMLSMVRFYMCWEKLGSPVTPESFPQ